MDAFRGHCVSMFKVSHSADVSYLYPVSILLSVHLNAFLIYPVSFQVLELIFNDYATQQQRWDILSEFYGKEFVLFRVSFLIIWFDLFKYLSKSRLIDYFKSSEWHKMWIDKEQLQTEKSRPIEQIVAEEPSKKKGIVKCIEEIVNDIVQKTTIKVCSIQFSENINDRKHYFININIFVYFRVLLLTNWCSIWWLTETENNREIWWTASRINYPNSLVTSTTYIICYLFWNLLYFLICYVYVFRSTLPTEVNWQWE